MKKYVVLFLILVSLSAVTSCKKNNGEDELELPPYNPTSLTLQIPSNLPEMTIPDDNKTTVEGVALGRMLYYDSLMHPLGEKACGSCHIQSAGFTTPGTNVMSHTNLGFHNKFLWNGSEQGTLEDAMRFEVEEFFQTDVNRLQQDESYPLLFYNAFGSTKIDTKKCAYALAQFLRTLISGNSKFDKFVRHEVVLTAEEMQGFNIFFTEKGDCFHCHSISLTTDGNLHNIGLDSVLTGVNAGYYNASNNPADLGKFKSANLRNCGIRSSFMHDGRFTTLEEVIEHYNSQVKISPSLDPILTKPGKEFGLQLTVQEKQYLKAFLLTLTDSVYLTNPDFSNPF